jgi:hypothetical protein
LTKPKKEKKNLVLKKIIIGQGRILELNPVNQLLAGRLKTT